MIKVVTFSYEDCDELNANTYLLVDSLNNVVVIDPSCDSPAIKEYIKKNKLQLKGILLTHSHFDHMRGIDILVKNFSVPIYVHEDDASGMKDSKINLSIFEKALIINHPFKTLIDKEKLALLEDDIEVIHTPYHSIGSVCYYIKSSNILLSGDTLFKSSIGRSDFKTSAPLKKDETFKKIMALKDDTKVYPGHGPKTTIGFERKYNHFISQ